MRGRIGAGVATLAVVVGGVSGCGYTMVKRSELGARRSPADSAMVVSLERQMAALTARCREDSVRYAALLAEKTVVVPAPSGVAAPADSVVKVRDGEIAALKDQLAKANEELERIKRRLASPRP